MQFSDTNLHPPRNKMPPPELHTYHCICNQLALATFGPLADTPTRSRDASAICPLAPPTAGSAVLADTTHVDAAPVVLKLADGFEKRYAVRCGRCELQIGYLLDWGSFGEGGSGSAGGRRGDVVFLLPGGLMGTEEMRAGRDMGKEIGVVGGAGG